MECDGSSDIFCSQLVCKISPTGLSEKKSTLCSSLHKQIQATSLTHSSLEIVLQWWSSGVPIQFVQGRRVGDIEGKTLFPWVSRECVEDIFLWWVSMCVFSIFELPAELKTLLLLLFCWSDEHIVHEECMVGSTGNHTNLRAWTWQMCSK